MAKTFLKVVVNTPDKLLWEGEAKFVSSKNSDGEFSIFPGHANFITVVKGSKILIKGLDRSVEYTFDNSVIYTHDNLVSVYTLV